MNPNRKIDVLLVGPIPHAQSYVGGIAVLLAQQLAHWELPMAVAHLNTELWAREFGTTGQFKLKHLLAFLINAIRLAGVVAWRRPRLIHFHSSVRLALIKDALLACGVRWIGGCKVVMHVHFAVVDAILLGRSLWLRRLQLWLLLLACDRIVLLSHSLRGKLAACLPSRTAARLLEKTAVLPNFTEVPDEPAPHRTGASPVKVFFIGNIGQRKGAYDLIRALPLVAAHTPQPFQLIFAGPFDSPDDQRSILQLAHELDLRDCVQFLGPVSGAAKTEAFRDADVFVLPSYGEGVPVALIEAMAYGIPVVATSVGGVPETVTDGQEGFLIQPGHVEALASTIARLIAAPGLRCQMGHAARVRATQRHSLRAYFAALGPLYSSLQLIPPCLNRSTTMTTLADHHRTRYSPTSAARRALLQERGLLPRRMVELGQEKALASSPSCRVILVSAVYPPEPVVSAREAQDVGQELLRRNCRVTVICPQPSRPLGTAYESYIKRQGPHVSWEDGIEVVRLPSFASPRSRLVGRAWESFSFGYHACKFLRGLNEQPDVLSVNSWPLASQALLAHYARAQRIPLVLHIKDIYPESLMAKLPKPLRNLAGAPLKGLDRRIANRAEKVVVISENMRRTYIEGRRIPADRVATVSSWQDEKLFKGPPGREASCLRYSVPANRFTLLYLGNIGPVAGVDFLIRSFCAARLHGAQLLIAGGGSARQAAMELAGKLRAQSVHFISDPDARNVALLQSMAHVCLLPMKRSTGMSSIPSKLPAYMFSARPVLATVDAGSDTACAIREADCGWVEPPEVMTALAERMRQVAELPAEELSRIGERGRAYGLRHFSKEAGVQRTAAAILKVRHRHQTSTAIPCVTL